MTELKKDIKNLEEILDRATKTIENLSASYNFNSFPLPESIKRVYVVRAQYFDLPEIRGIYSGQAGALRHLVNLQATNKDMVYWVEEHVMGARLEENADVVEYS